MADTDKCYADFIGFKVCGATESKSGLYIDSSGFTVRQGAQLANSDDVTAKQYYKRIHDQSMELLKDYFFEALSKHHTYMSFLGREISGNFTKMVTQVTTWEYTIEDLIDVHRYISRIWIRPDQDAIVTVNGEQYQVYEGKLKEIAINEQTVIIQGDFGAYECAGDPVKMEIVSQCDPDAFFCRFLKYLKTPALYMVEAQLALDGMTTERNSAYTVNMNGKFNIRYMSIMGGTDPVTGIAYKSKFWAALNSAVKRLGYQLQESQCIKCSGPRIQTNIP